MRCVREKHRSVMVAGPVLLSSPDTSIVHADVESHALCG